MPSHSHDAYNYYASGGSTGSHGTTYTTKGGYANWGFISIQPTGGDTPHNNIQPYIVTYMWKRVS